MENNNLLKISKKELEIVNNYNLSFKEFGDKKNSTMVLIHGYADHYKVYDSLIEKYKNKYHIYAIQLPSVSNETVVSKLQLKPIVFAYHVFKFLKDHNLKDVILIGHSMGGGIVTFVNNLVDKGVIKTSILFNPMNSSNGVNIMNIFKLNPSNLLGLIKVLPLIYKYPFKIFGQDLNENETLIESGKRYGYTHHNNKILFNRMAGLKNKKYLFKAKKNNPIKSVVIFGQDDRLLKHNNAKKSFLKGQNYSFETIEDSGHVPFLDQPEATYIVMEKWLEKFK